MSEDRRSPELKLMEELEMITEILKIYRETMETFQYNINSLNTKVDRLKIDFIKYCDCPDCKK
jgi:hypothetical protein